MNANTFGYFSGSAMAAAFACAANLIAVVPATADIQIGALACQPPYLEQAQQLRWHEHYLINPVDSVPTWVVCPIAFDSNALGSGFMIGAFGNTRPGALSTIQCYANVVDLRNQNIPEGGFLPNPGQNMIFSRIMETQNPSNTLWSAWLDVKQSQIIGIMNSPPSTPVNPAGGAGPAFWTITVNCLLQPGQALNMVSLWPTL